MSYLGERLQKKVYEGSIDYVQIMDENGNIDQALFPKDLDDQKILAMYKMMVFARALDAKLLSLQRQGRLATFGPLVGEEATQVGAAFAMGENDYFVPNFRQHGVFLARGFPIRGIVLAWKGFEEGGMIPKDKHALPVAVSVATQMPHAMGLAFAQKYRGTGANVVSFIGDGGTSEGDFYEAINFAGVFKVPLVAIIENNQWAISVPRSKQTAAQTLAQKAIAAGIPGVQIDGNDVVGVYKAVKTALANAKNGPTVIECVTYRMSLHTTADDPTKYRPDSDVEAWKPKDPILRVRRYLEKKGLWDDGKETALAEEQLKLIDEGVEEAEKFVPDPTSMFKNIYSFIPETLQEEMDEGIAANFWQEEKKSEGEGV